MKKFLRVVALLVVILVAAFFFVVPPVVDSAFNEVVRGATTPISQNALALHNDLRILDLHADALLWGRNLLKRNTRGAVDVPRLVEGNVALEVFTAVTKTPRGLNYERNDASTDNIFWLALSQRWPPRTWSSLTERALYLAERFDATVAGSNGTLVPIRNVRDLAAYLERREKQKRITAGILGIEGAQALDGKLENLDRLADAGYRYISLAHFFDDEFAGSSAGVEKGGLTPLGRELVRRMNEKRIIIDLAHASPETIHDVLAATTRPVICSHGGLRGNCDNRRNLTDEEARGIARTGGIIGIGFWSTAVCGERPGAIAKAMRYAAGVVGTDHVALGSDFDGAVHTPFDAAELPELTDALLEEGFSAGEIRAIMGENALRFFRENLPE
jgi:microsomal dipeptidase-like Zn-dependent dipeptidase